MQGSKVKARETYAVNTRGELEQFKVFTVTTVKTGDHASEQTTTVTGRYANDDGGWAGDDVDLPAKALLGHYSDYTTLVEKEKAAKAEAARKAKEAEAEHERLWKRLYELTGRPLPAGKKSRWRGEDVLEFSASDGDIFHRTYRGGFEVTNEGAEVLIAALERVQRLKIVS
jgi:hypothetical protein